MNSTSNSNLRPVLIVIAVLLGFLILLALVFVAMFLVMGGMMGMMNMMGTGNMMGSGMTGDQAYKDMIAACTSMMNPTMGSPMAWLWWLGWLLPTGLLIIILFLVVSLMRRSPAQTPRPE